MPLQELMNSTERKREDERLENVTINKFRKPSSNIYKNAAFVAKQKKGDLKTPEQCSQKEKGLHTNFENAIFKLGF